MTDLSEKKTDVHKIVLILPLCATYVSITVNVEEDQLGAKRWKQHDSDKIEEVDNGDHSQEKEPGRGGEMRISRKQT